jgi:hypothetical protein
MIYKWSYLSHPIFAIGTILEALGVSQLRVNFQRTAQRLPELYELRPFPIRGDSNQKLYTELIQWSQRVKARAVVESLGTEIALPEIIIAGLRPDSVGIKMIMEESALQSKQPESLLDKIELGQKLEQLRDKIRTEPNLQLVMDIREGACMEEAQIKELAENFGSDATIVDWLYLPTEVCNIPTT